MNTWMFSVKKKQHNFFNHDLGTIKLEQGKDLKPNHLKITI